MYTHFFQEDNFFQTTFKFAGQKNAPEELLKIPKVRFVFLGASPSAGGTSKGVQNEILEPFLLARSKSPCHHVRHSKLKKMKTSIERTLKH